MLLEALRPFSESRNRVIQVGNERLPALQRTPIRLARDSLLGRGTDAPGRGARKESWPSATRHVTGARTLACAAETRAGPYDTPRPPEGKQLAKSAATHLLLKFVGESLEVIQVLGTAHFVGIAARASREEEDGVGLGAEHLVHAHPLVGVQGLATVHQQHLKYTFSSNKRKRRTQSRVPDKKKTSRRRREMWHYEEPQRCSGSRGTNLILHSHTRRVVDKKLQLSNCLHGSADVDLKSRIHGCSSFSAFCSLVLCALTENNGHTPKHSSSAATRESTGQKVGFASEGRGTGATRL